MTDHVPGALIAVVDDDQRILKSLENLLESADYACSLSPRPRTTRKRVSGKDRLPDLGHRHARDGWFRSVAAVARQARPELPIILITGHPDMLNRLPAVGAGHYRLFKKPFDGQELLTAVSDALRNPRLPKLES